MKTFLVKRHSGAWRIVVAGTPTMAKIISGFHDSAKVTELDIDKAANNSGGVVLESEDDDDEDDEVDVEDDSDDETT